MIEGIDYFVRYVQFPNRANDGCVIVNDDGTFDIYLNTLYDMEHLKEKLQHELRHLENEHFYIDAPIALIEKQADGDLSAVLKKEIEQQSVSKEFIMEFKSLDALLKFALQNGGL